MARRGVLWLLVAALVLAQAIGLMHRSVHLPHLHTGSHASSHAVAGHAHGHGNWVARMFSGHSDDSSCRLFDPLNHDAAPCVPAVVLPLAAAEHFLAFFQGEFLARWAALYDARGPPSFR